MLSQDSGFVSKQKTCWFVGGLVLLIASISSLEIASAQAPKAAKSKSARKAPEDPKLKPRWVPLRTKDGVEMRAFYAPSENGKNAVPVMIIHEWQGQGSPYGTLVKTLHDAGCAVIVPEYRGHGGSRNYIDASGQTKEFNIATMGKADVANIILYDLEEVKQFLKKENNAGNLNLNALTLVGVSEGAIFAANWAVRDWSFPSVGKLKQGQDVKGLVFVSPVKNANGMTVDSVLGNPSLLQLPIMLVAGEQSEDASEATRIAKRIESLKKRMSRGAAISFTENMVATSLSGPALIVEGPGVMPAIAAFIKANVPISENVNPWVERE